MRAEISAAGSRVRVEFFDGKRPLYTSGLTVEGADLAALKLIGLRMLGYCEALGIPAVLL